MPPEMWRSWSKKGRADAAAAMGVPVETIIRTSNHLESFNGKLKGAEIPQWQHSGRCLRFDVLTYHLVIDIVPRIFVRHRIANAYSEWKTERFCSAAGGADLRSVSTNGTSGAQGAPRGTSSATGGGFVARTWYADDARRDQAARTLFAENHLHPIPAGCAYELWATCRSSEDASRHYSLTVHPSGAATCTCLDWRQRGGACKHLRAFRILLDEWSRCGQLSHRFLFPLTEAEAVETEQRNRQWYGNAYSSAVTSATSSPTHKPAPINVAPSHSSPPTSSSASSPPACHLPPAHLDDVLPASLGLALELENLEGDHSVITVATGASGVGPDGAPRARTMLPTVGQVGVDEGDTVSGLEVTFVITADFELYQCRTTLATVTAPRSEPLASVLVQSANQRAVHLQVQTQLETDITYLLPRLHGLNSTLRGSQHVLDPSSNMLEFRAALEEFRDLYEAHLPTPANDRLPSGMCADCLLMSSLKACVVAFTPVPPSHTTTTSNRAATPSSSTAMTSTRPGSAIYAHTGAQPSILKRRLPPPLPPSPEPKQKRKKSFKTT